MSPDTVSPLRQRMIEDMIMRQFGEHTQRDYVRQVCEFTAFLARSPRPGRAGGTAALPGPLGLARGELFPDESRLRGAALLLARHAQMDRIR
jgi:hypothetical protein